MGVHKSRWAFRSSTPVLGRVAVQGGFDSHAFPLFFYYPTVEQNRVIQIIDIQNKVLDL